MLFYTHLVGNHKCRPVILLKASSAGFTDRSAGLKPAIAASGGFNRTNAHDWWSSGENMIFYSQILHLHIKIAAGNAAATAVWWGVAQQYAAAASSLDDMPLKAELNTCLALPCCLPHPSLDDYTYTAPGEGTLSAVERCGPHVAISPAVLRSSDITYFRPSLNSEN